MNHITNQPSKFRTRNWVEINYQSREKYDSSRTKFKASMISSNLCDYSDAYILISGTITITGEGGDDSAKIADKRNKGVIFKNCSSFTECINNINNIQIDHEKI